MASRPQLELGESSRAHGSLAAVARTQRSDAGSLGSEPGTDEPCRSGTLRRSSRDADGWTDDNALTQRYDTYKVSMPSPMRLRARVIQASTQARIPSLFGIASIGLHRGKS